MTLTIIVATDRAGGIGIENRLPWRLPEDLAHFKRMTTGHPIIMGRKTFESIGRALPGRRNIVVTRNPDWRHEGVDSVPSLPAAVALVAGLEAFVIGGAEIYAQALPACHRLVITAIDSVYDCDAFFPAIDATQWQETAREAYYSEQLGSGYAFVTYARRPA
ncbi:MAG: dihydrofolate reductase [Herminiimonas sp.]|nr:dihydrofolate reductase [Herminiimonas sp.]